MQGPYVYKLYAEYGFQKGDIAMLFIMGFGSSLVFGTIVGGVADRYGRKANCLIFVLLYSISCITKHFNNYTILMLGRLLGGISTSILMSAFETWMIHEHRTSGYSEDWMTNTFSHMTFGSGLVAIGAGLFASVLVETFGYVAPFDASLVLLVGGGYVIFTSWKENFGDNSRITSGLENFDKAWRLLISSEKIFLLGVIQSCFEASMYIFVFMWTPALEGTLQAGEPSLPHGLVFAGFMVCLMIGSKLFELLVKQYSVEFLNRWLFVVASAALAIPIVLPRSHNAVLLGFCVFEVCCGVYFPSMVRAAMHICHVCAICNLSHSPSHHFSVPSPSFVAGHDAQQAHPRGGSLDRDERLPHRPQRNRRAHAHQHRLPLLRHRVHALLHPAHHGGGQPEPALRSRRVQRQRGRAVAIRPRSGR
jgi:MFS family permease